MAEKTILTTILGLLITINLQAKHGADDGYEGHFSSHKVVCLDAKHNVILTVPASQKSAQVKLADYSMSVSAVSGDIKEISLKDIRSEDMIIAQRSEELLTVTLVTDENPNYPTIVRAYTHRGLAQVNQQDESGDAVHVYSYERKGESIMKIKLTTDENPTAAIEVNCKKTR